MKHLCIVAISAALSAACLATESSDAVDASVVKAIMPSGGSSAVVSPYSVAVAAGLLGDGMDSRDARIALSEKMGLKTTSFGPTFLRNRMKSEGIDIYLLANSDPHQSEYLPDHWKCVEWLTGFKGEVATVCITPTEALLWTDSRFFINAALLAIKQLLIADF